MPRSLTEASLPQSQSQASVPKLEEQLRHIMIISNNMELAESLQLEMMQVGYQVSVIHDGLRGLMAAQRVEPDLVIVSWSPPRLSGLEICDRLLARGQQRAVILITESNSPDERIEGLRRGASDCISMPCNMEEFMARVRCKLPQQTAEYTEEKCILRCADLTLNRSTREVFRGENFIRLTAKEFDLLNYLMSNYFKVVTRAQVLENVWGYDYCGSSNIVEVYIRYLRKKLTLSSDHKLIHTVRGIGYILREPHSKASSSQEASPQEAAPQPRKILAHKSVMSASKPSAPKPSASKYSASKPSASKSSAPRPREANRRTA